MVTRVPLDGDTTTGADDLEALSFTPIGGQAAADQQGQADEAEQAGQAEREREAKLLRTLVMGTRVVIVGLLRAARTRIAKRMPEILDEWPDGVLIAPADAAVPVLQKYAGGLVNILGQHAELGALVFACAPLALGYVSAMARANHTAARTVEAEPATPSDGQA